MTEAGIKRLTRTLAEIQPAVGATSTTIDNWVVRLNEKDLLTTEYAPSVQGRERAFTRHNTIELAIIAALVRAGVTPRVAAPYAAMGLRNLSGLRSGAQKEWLVFAAGDASKAVGADTPNVNDLAKNFGAVALSFVHIGEIIRRVNALFDGEAA